jgi:hypothetical protein
MIFFPSIGQTKIVCSLNLAGGESAEVTVNAALYQATLKTAYPTVARIELPSEAEASEGEGREGFARFVGSGIANAVTVANAGNVIVGDGIEALQQNCQQF